MTHTLTTEQLQRILAMVDVPPKMQAIILENYMRLQMRAELAEAQLAYWIEQAERHGHGPDSEPDPLPFAEEVEDED